MEENKDTDSYRKQENLLLGLITGENLMYVKSYHNGINMHKLI